MSNASADRIRIESNKFHGKSSRLSGRTSTARVTDSDSESDICIDKTLSFQKQLSDTDKTCSKVKQDSTESKTKITLKRKVSDDFNSIGLKKRCGSEEVLPAKIDKVQQLQLDVFKDSGFSSSSSQERTPTEEEKGLFEETSSQETIESTQDDCHLVANLDNANVLELNAPIPKDRQHYPTLSQVSCMSADSVLYSRKKETLFDDNKASLLRESQSSDLSTFLNSSENSLGSCMFCLSEPKNSVFVHSNFVHLCCCYKCAMKVWKQRKSCPICNCKVKNVMKLFVH